MSSVEVVAGHHHDHTGTAARAGRRHAGRLAAAFAITLSVLALEVVVGIASGMFAALYRAGYDGDVIIEHEDRDFEGADERVKRGFILARGVLRPYVV